MYAARDRGRTYGAGDRSGPKTRSFKCILEPSPEIALGFEAACHTFLIQTLVDGLQICQGRDEIRTKCVKIRTECTISWRLWKSISALSFSSEDRTYRYGAGRSGLQTGSFKCSLEPAPEVALAQGAVRLGFMKTVVDGFQICQARDEVRSESAVSWRL